MATTIGEVFGTAPPFFARVAPLLLLAALSGCGCDRAAAPSGGPGRGRIVVYTALEADQVGPFLGAFRRDHPGIDVTVVRDSTGVITARLLSEAADPKADVVWGLAATGLLAAGNRGLLEPYAPPGLEQIDPRFRDDADPPAWVGTVVLTTALAANAPELKRRNLPVPQTFDDLADPAYRGLVTMPHPSSSGTGFLIVCGLLQGQGEEAGWAYLDRLHLNVAQYTHSGSKPATLASAGEYPLGVALDQRCVAEKSRGAPIEVVFPKDKVGWEVEATALVRKDDRPEAAKTFFDWAVSAAAFEEYTKYAAAVSHARFRAPPPGYPPGVLDRLVDLDLRRAAEDRERVLSEWNRRYGGKGEAK